LRHEVVQSDITVIGGGLAGVCAAVAAARLGKTVSLVQNRPVLGGNSSSEVRVWVCGATAHGTQRYSRETGIMGEMFVENQYRNPDGNPYIWDLVVLETVKAEKNIQLFLNTDVHEVQADGNENNRHIHSVTGWMMGSERKIRFESKVFLDCTGDGLVGFLAGAKYRIGREARHEYNEDWAPEVEDNITLGSTLLFYTKDAGHPIKYIPPSFAKDITQTTIPLKRVIRSGDSGCHYWWIEWGGELDTVHENERIRDELSSVIYGIWDYIKNSGKFDAENMTLEWVGSLPGKREYRRFIGDYVLTQNDILNQTPFEDRVAFGGWSIDLHPPQGMYATESGSKHLHADGNYHIPFRSLYSVNTSNLLFAGRNISASHVAFGTTRVMATCAVMGEAAGTGAALCVEKNVTPRELYQNQLEELKQVMVRQDASVLGVKNEDKKDHAKNALVTASSTLSRISIETPVENYKLSTDVGILIPVDTKLGNIELLLDAIEPTRVEIEIWDTGKEQNYVPYSLQTKTTSYVERGEKRWVTFELNLEVESAQNAFVIIKANNAVSLYQSSEPVTGVISFEKGPKPIVSKDLEEHQPDQPVVQWRMRGLARKPFCLRVLSETKAYSPEKIIDGYVRPYGSPHLWSSDWIQKNKEEWVELKWDTKIEVKELHLTFNDDVNEDLINLHHHRTPFEVIPELVKDYRLEALINGEWRVIHKEKSNRKRKRVHHFDTPIAMDRLRIVVSSTNGSNRVEIIEARVYSDKTYK